MAHSLQQVVHFLDQILEPQEFQDYCPNGLQVEGASKVNTLVTGVTASQALIDRAIDLGADMILVHHGYFWKNEDPRVTGMKRKRLQALLNNNISLVAYHLPLDAHPVHGNNAQLAALLGIKTSGGLQAVARPIGNVGELEESVSLSEFGDLVAARLGREPLVIPAGSGAIQKIAWCTGAAQDYIDQAAALNADVYLSGEVSEQTFHVARELGIHYIAAGHHATERYGVKALGALLAERFKLDHHYIELDNPV